MAMAHLPLSDEDLTLRFRWHWSEHGIYVGVCGLIGLLVSALYVYPTSSQKRFDPTFFSFIQTRYVAPADEPPEKEDPFRDPRVIHARAIY
jgi:hypothetical protein